MASRWPKMAPRRPQDRPKIAPRWPKMAPRWPKMAPRRPKKAPGWLQVASHRDLVFIFSSATCPKLFEDPPQDPPGGPPDAPKRPLKDSRSRPQIAGNGGH